VGFRLATTPTPLLKDVNFAPTLDSDPDDAQIERMLAESHSSGSNEVK
jgi:hypothetical protein